MLQKIYYTAKPWIPRPWRLSLRRRYTAAIRRATTATWPIDPIAARAPKGWSGWPGEKKFALVLTHDVETKEGLENLPALLDVEAELGLHSSVNLIPEAGYRVSSAFLERLRAREVEVGLHGLKHDGKLYRSRRVFEERRDRINEYIKEWKSSGFRSPLMQNNLEWIAELDVEYDMSTFDTDPFEPQPLGTRTIFPFWVPRKASDGAYVPGNGYVELSYTLPQDSTLYLLLGQEDSSSWIQKLDWIAQSGGMALLNTHPDYVSFGDSDHTRSSYPASRYREFLRYVIETYGDDVWYAKPNEVASYFRKTHVLGKDLETLADEQLIRPLATKRCYSVVHSYYPNDPRPRREAEALAEAGMTLEVTCLGDREDAGRKYYLGGVVVNTLGIKKKRGGALSYLYEYSYIFLASLLKQLKILVSGRIDVVHVHNMPDFLVFSGWLSRQLGAKVVLDLHDPMPELMSTIFGVDDKSIPVRILREIERRSIGFSDLTITVNETCRKMFSNRSNPKAPIEVLMNLPDEAIFEARSPSAVSVDVSEPLKAMYHGSILERNGLDLLVRALRVCREEGVDIDLEIFGKVTPYLEETMELVREFGMDDRIQFSGTRRIEEIPTEIDRFDIGVIPNRVNRFTQINTPTRIFEYLSRGKPVISPRSEGVTDYFPEDALYYFELGSERSLADALIRVNSDRVGLEAVAQRGVRVYESNRWSRKRNDWIASVAELTRR